MKFQTAFGFEHLNLLSHRIGEYFFGVTLTISGFGRTEWLTISFKFFAPFYAMHIPPALNCLKYIEESRGKHKKPLPFGRETRIHRRGVAGGWHYRDVK